MVVGSGLLATGVLVLVCMPSCIDTSTARAGVALQSMVLIAADHYRPPSNTSTDPTNDIDVEVLIVRVIELVIGPIRSSQYATLGRILLHPPWVVVHRFGVSFDPGGVSSGEVICCW